MIQFIYTKLLSVLKMLTVNKQPLHKWTHINKLPLPHRVISERDHFTPATLLLTRIYHQLLIYIEEIAKLNDVYLLRSFDYLL